LGLPTLDPEAALNYASPGSGSLQHLATVLFSKKAGIQMVHVPYKSGGDAVVSLLGNTSQLFFAGMPPALPHVKSGKLRALAVTTAQRSQSAKEVPTMAEAGYPGIEADNWHAIAVPAGTSPDIVAQLEKEFMAVLGQPNVKEGFFNAGAEAHFLSAKALGGLIGAEAAKWTEAVKEAGVKTSQ
jgi:tripartite-type tricarboxylate transporter receptor subunit TctC